jgi:integrase
MSQVLAPRLELFRCLADLLAELDKGISETMGMEIWKASTDKGLAKDRPLLQVLFHTMARIDEVLRLKWEDVNFQEQAVRLWTRKRRGGNGESDWLPMNADLEQVMWSLWQKRSSEEWVFCNPRTGTRYTDRFLLMRNICQRAGGGTSVRLPYHPSPRGQIALRQEEGVPAGDLRAPALQELADHGAVSSSH